MAAFWKQVSSTNDDLVAWMSRRCASEYCGLLALCARVEHATIHVVDVAPLNRDAFSVVAKQEIVNQDAAPICFRASLVLEG